MANTRKSFAGAAVPTTLTAGITSTATIIPVAATTNFPNTAVGPFVVVVDRGQGSLEEKVLVSSFTATTLTVAANGRGYDGTTAQAHTTGATVAHCLDAATITEHDAFVCGVGSVNPHASAVGDTTTAGSSTYASRADHRHARENWATGATTTSAPGDVKSDGTSTSPARADHKHGRESLTIQCPVGAIVTWASTTAPTNWLLLHGQTVSGGAATYPTLASVYPSWVVSGNLVLPDTRTKFILGAGGTHAAGATGGSSTTTLTSAMLPTTTVTITDPGHVHTPSDPGHHHKTFTATTSYQAMYTDPTPANTRLNGPGTGTGTYVTWNATNVDQNATTGVTIGSHTTGLTAKIGSASPTGVPITPPFLALSKIVRAK